MGHSTRRARKTRRKLQNTTSWMLLANEMCSTTPCATITDSRVGTHSCEQCSSNKMREDAVKKFVKHQRKINFEEAYQLHFRRSISEECQSLIRSCLKIRPNDRIGLEQILSHPWLSSVDEDIQITNCHKVQDAQAHNHTASSCSKESV